MWLLTIHHFFFPSPALLQVAIPGISCARRTIFPMLKTWKATTAKAVFTCTNFETGSKLHHFWGIVVHARANQYSMKSPSSFRSLILNSHCSYHRRRLFSTPKHLIGCCFTYTQSFRRSLLHQLWLAVYRQIWNIHSPFKPQLEPEYHDKYKVQLHAVVHPIYTSCYESYAS